MIEGNPIFAGGVVIVEDQGCAIDLDLFPERGPKVICYHEDDASAWSEARLAALALLGFRLVRRNRPLTLKDYEDLCLASPIRPDTIRPKRG